MHQPLIGAAFPFLIAAVVYAFHRGRCSLAFLIVTPVLMAACAVWAVVPDIPRLIGRHGLYLRLARDPRMDIFFWHYTIDRYESYYAWCNGLYAVLIAALLFVAWRELSRREREAAAAIEATAGETN